MGAENVGGMKKASQRMLFLNHCLKSEEGFAGWMKRAVDSREQETFKMERPERG